MSFGGPDSTVSTGAPEYLQPYISQMLQYAQQNVDTPYATYDGPRIAEQSPLYMSGAEELANNTTSPYIDMAGTGAAGAYDTLTSKMAAPTWSETEGKPVAKTWTGEAAPGGTYTPYGKPTTDTWAGGYNFTEGSWTDPGIANAYMNPYTQGVLDIQRREANLAADKENEKYRTTAASRGAFGGSRSALIEGELNKNRLQNLSDIEAKGLNDAYLSGMGQFNTETAGKRELLKMGLGQFNADELRQLDAWKYGADQSNAEANRALEAWKANTGQYNADANRELDAWSKGAGQYNAEMGTAISGAGQQSGLASLLKGVGETDYSQNRQRIQDMMNLGLTEEGRRQRELDMDYEDFKAQRDYPTEKLKEFARLIYGQPGTTETKQAAPPSWLAQMAGLGTLLWGGTGAAK